MAREKSWWETQVDEWFDWFASPEFKQSVRNFFSFKALTFKQKKYVGIGILAIVVILFLCIVGPCSSNSPPTKAEKPAVEKVVEKVGDEYDADVEAYVREAKRQNEDWPSGTGSSYGGYSREATDWYNDAWLLGPRVGAIGMIIFPVKVVQIIDEQSALVEITVPDNSSSTYDTKKRTVFLHGVILSDVVDGERLTFTEMPYKYMKITGTKTYSTAIGGTKTVYVMEPLSRKVHLGIMKRIREVKEKQEAERDLERRIEKLKEKEKQEGRR